MPANPMPSWFPFLRIEADLAMTFIGLAKNHLDPEHSSWSLENARKALAEIQRRLINPTRHGLSEHEIVFLSQRCTEIESALRAASPA
jgi:cob(I)alamin adenosyltransferase